MRLQGRFLITVIPVIALSVIGLGAIVYSQLIRNSEQSVVREVQMAQELVAMRTAAAVDTAETNAILLSDSAQIADWFRHDPVVRNWQAVRSLFRTVQSSYPSYREIRLLNRDGRELIRMASDELGNVSATEQGTPWFADVALNWGASIHTQVIDHSEDGKSSLTVARPVRLPNESGDGDTLHGYVVISATMEAIAEQVASYAVSHEGFIAMTDTSGRVFYASDGRSELATSVAAAWPKASAHEGGQRELRNVTVDSAHYKVSVRMLFDGVKILVVIPGTALNAVAEQIRKTVGIFTAGAILLFSILFIALVRSVVLSPIQRLQSVVTARGKGETEAAFENSRNDEIGDLSRSFQSMTDKLSRSMSELQDSHAHIESMAYLDVLTGLPNRRRFLKLLACAVQRANDTSETVALLYFDLDEFKSLNDNEGHRAGDRLLQEVANRLKACVAQRSSEKLASDHPVEDHVARMGGDEFVVLLNNVTSEEEVAEFAATALGILSQPISIGEHDRTMLSSVGIALCPVHAQDADDLIVCSDMAMYDVKRRGTHSWCIYDVSMRESIKSKREFEEDLLYAVNNQLRLQYQPQYRMSNCLDGDVTELWGMEALLRWEHPERGLVSPVDFIPVAEETGLIVDIGNWVINEACRQWTQWNEAGLAPERIAVNVSQRQFSLSDVAKTVEEALTTHAIPPSALEIEITESCMMDASSNVIESLEYIRRLGVHVAMDDFGTGHSSLGALTQLPIDTLKVDRCFVSGLEQGSANDTIVAAVLMLADTLDLTVVAEGVETTEELERLQWHRCDVGQGYLLARPLWEADATAMLQARAQCVAGDNEAHGKAA